MIFLTSFKLKIKLEMDFVSQVAAVHHLVPGISDLVDIRK